MCDPISAAVVGSAVIGAGSSAIQGKKARKAQAKAQAANEASAAREAQRSEEQYNKANQRMPDVGALFAANQKAANRGLGSTFLTGPTGPGRAPLGGAVSLLGG